MIKLKRVQRQNGQPISTIAIADLAVFTDRAKKTMEACVTECVRVVELVVNDDTFHVGFEIGALDSKGEFHPDRSFPLAGWRIDRTGNELSQALWSKYIAGRDTFSKNEIIAWAHAEGAFKAMGLNKWGMPDLESEEVAEEARS